MQELLDRDQFFLPLLSFIWGLGAAHPDPNPVWDPLWVPRVGLEQELRFHRAEKKNEEDKRINESCVCSVHSSLLSPLSHIFNL